MPPKPYALILGAPPAASPDAEEAALRRMGLRPQRLVADGSGEAQYRLQFGATAMVLARADPSTCDEADPGDPATSSLATSLPRGWRDRGCCWLLHLPGADAAPNPDMRDLFKTIVLLIDLFDASHIFWGPARLWSDAPQFRASVAEMMTSGMPPVLHLVAFRRGDDGGAATMHTRGLALFGEQEIAAGVPAGWTTADMVKRMARIAIDLMINGPVRAPQRTSGLGPGEVVELLPPDREDGAAVVRVVFGRGD